MEKETYTIEEAGRILGLGRSAAYAAAKRGDIPCLKIGKRLIVPCVALKEMLRVPPKPKKIKLLD